MSGRGIDREDFDPSWELTQLGIQLDVKDQEIAELRDRISDLLEENQSYVDEISDKTSMIDQLEGEIYDLKQEVRDLERDAERHEDRISDLEDEVSSLEEFFETVDKHLYSGGNMVFSIPNFDYLLFGGTYHVLNFEHTFLLREVYVDYILQTNGFEIYKKQDFKNHSIFYYAKYIGGRTGVKVLDNDLYRQNKNYVNNTIYNMRDDVGYMNITSLATALLQEKALVREMDRIRNEEAGKNLPPAPSPPEDIRILGWKDFREKLNKLTEEQLRQLINFEISSYGRTLMLERMHQRYCILRDKRERQQVLDREILL